LKGPRGNNVDKVNDYVYVRIMLYDWLRLIGEKK